MENKNTDILPFQEWASLIENQPINLENHPDEERTHTTCTEGRKSGILPFQELTSLVKNQAIFFGSPPDEDQIQPASIDLRLGKTMWRIRASCLPGKNKKVQELVKSSDIVIDSIDISDASILEKDCVYIAKLQESLNLPKDISATANPKSSTGRLDIFTRVITDNGTAFDRIPLGYGGPLYIEICPKSFPIKVRMGSRLSQVRFRRKSARISNDEFKQLHNSFSNEGDVYKVMEKGIERGIDISVDLKGDSEGDIIGYRAKRHTAVVDVDLKQYYNINEFWEPILAPSNNSIILDPNGFYILVSEERVIIPPRYAAEMLPIDPLIGEFRVHYAGFFDPGFGYSKSGGSGSRAVLEVRSHDVPFLIEHGQTVGRLIYEKMFERPEVVYGKDLNSNYQGQSLKLSKHFKVE